jgi:hypothetical protein
MNEVRNERNELNAPSGYTMSEWSKSPNGLEGRVKSPIIWGHAKEKNCIFPVAYLRKPKWMDEESWKKVVDCIELKMPNETFLSYNAEVTHD